MDENTIAHIRNAAEITEAETVAEDIASDYWGEEEAAAFNIAVEALLVAFNNDWVGLPWYHTKHPPKHMERKVT